MDAKHLIPTDFFVSSWGSDGGSGDESRNSEESSPQALVGTVRIQVNAALI